jgi:hypothetical protein
MFSYYINAAATCIISEGDIESMSQYSLDHSFAMKAFEQAHLLPLSRFFAVFTSIV